MKKGKTKVLRLSTHLGLQEAAKAMALAVSSYVEHVSTRVSAGRTSESEATFSGTVGHFNVYSRVHLQDRTP